VSLKRSSQIVIAAFAFVSLMTIAARGDSGLRTLPVARVTLYPGDVIVADAIVERQFAASALSQMPVYGSRALLVGKVARRTLVAGRPITLGAVRDQDVIKQGRPAALVLQSRGLIIMTNGIALQSGGVGDVIRVRNQDTGIVVVGRIEADGAIRVDLQ
jgi:flagellar basal body P-ring formation protein FlgA